MDFKDPTKQEMMDHLKQCFKGLVNVDSEEEFTFPATIAIHWYSSHYHSGQWSNLYSVSCTSGYKPNMATYEHDIENDPTVEEMYCVLEREFGGAK